MSAQVPVDLPELRSVLAGLKSRDLWRPVAGQTALFDLNAPTQLALFGDDVPIDVLAEGEL